MMDSKSLAKIAKEIIDGNIYLTLATTGEGKSWAAPLYFCKDNHYNFYFISSADCRHARELKINPNVAWAIFNSQAKEGQGNGVQIEGKAYQLSEKDLDEALKWYLTAFIPCTKEYFLGQNFYKLFKLVPEKFFVLDPTEPVDKRVEIKL